MMESINQSHAAPGSANPLVWGGDKAQPQGPSSLGEGTRQDAQRDGQDNA